MTREFLFALFHIRNVANLKEKQEQAKNEMKTFKGMFAAFYLYSCSVFLLLGLWAQIHMYIYFEVDVHVFLDLVLQRCGTY